jgi:hypothetical protein
MLAVWMELYNIAVYPPTSCHGAHTRTSMSCISVGIRIACFGVCIRTRVGDKCTAVRVRVLRSSNGTSKSFSVLLTAAVFRGTFTEPT